MANGVRACVLAAGKGTRMGGDKPKVLFEVEGKPLLHWVLGALSAAGIDNASVVVGFKKNEVIAQLPTEVRWVEQSPQLGTGHAVRCARSLFENDEPILVTFGDMPLIRAETYRAVVSRREKNAAACVVLTVKIPLASRFGRVLTDADGNITRIVEYKDATDEERTCEQGNSGVMCFRAAALWDALEQIGNSNQQGEYYLTDVIEILIQAGEKVLLQECADENEALGINTPEDLARVEAVIRERE